MIKNRINSLGLLALTMSMVNAEDSVNLEAAKSTEPQQTNPTSQAQKDKNIFARTWSSLHQSNPAEQTQTAPTSQTPQVQKVEETAPVDLRLLTGMVEDFVKNCPELLENLEDITISDPRIIVDDVTPNFHKIWMILNGGQPNSVHMVTDTSTTTPASATQPSPRLENDKDDAFTRCHKYYRRVIKKSDYFVSLQEGYNCYSTGAVPVPLLQSLVASAKKKLAEEAAAEKAR